MENNEALNVVSEKPAEEISIFTAKRIVKDGIEYKVEHTSEGLRVPMVYPNPNKDIPYGSGVCYILIPKEEIIKCLKEYLPEIIYSTASDNPFLKTV